jgi:hypothetical protein
MHNRQHTARLLLHPDAAGAVSKGESAMSTPFWDKNNHAFWFAVCIAISVVFALGYHLPHFVTG